MKPSLAALAFTVSLITTVHAEDCDIEQLKPLFVDTSVVECTDASGFSLVPSVKPSSEVLAKLCTSDACQSMLTTLQGLHMGDCTLLNIQLETDLLTPAKETCAASKNTTTSATTGDKESAEPPQAMTEDSTETNAATVSPSRDLTNTFEPQAPRSDAAADSATKTVTSTVSSTASSRSTAAVAIAAFIAATTLLQPLV